MGGLLTGVLILFASSYYKFILSAVLGVLVIWAVFLEKEYVLNEEGVSIYYNMKLLSHTDLWPWKDITSLHWDKVRHTEQVQIHFGKGAMTRLLLFSGEELEGIIRLAKKANPKIIVAEVDRKN